MGDGLSLQKISRVEIEENEGEVLFIYGKKGCGRRSDASSEAEPIKTSHLSKALNTQRFEETHVNNIPASLENKLHNPSV